jgi:hypothetical protein
VLSIELYSYYRSAFLLELCRQLVANMNKPCYCPLNLYITRTILDSITVSSDSTESTPNKV